MKRFLLVAALSLLANAAFAQVPALTFILETSTTADKAAVVPRLTWSTSPASTSCTASGTSDWTGTKAAAGTVLLAAVNATRTYSLVCNWPGVTLAVVNWTAPTTNTDGSALTDLAGFRIMYGRAATETALDTSVYTTTPAVTTWNSPVLTPGAWYFAVKAVNSMGLESALSNITSKTMTAAASDQRALALTIKFPSAPTGVQ